MPLPPSGTISLNQVNTELNQPATQTIGLGDANVRALAQVPSGPISMSNLYGKSSSFNAYLAGGTDVNARNVAISQGWDQQSYLILNITGPMLASSTGGYALTIQGAYPSGVRLNNGSNIVGRGGNGGNNDAAGAAAGNAIQLSSGFTLDINNTGIIAGGGGGGGGGGSFKFKQSFPGGGGGGGRSTNEYPTSGGTGGSPGGGGNFNGAGAGGPGGGGGAGGPGGNWGDGGAPGEPSDQAGGAPGGGGGAAIIKNGANVNYILQGQIFGRVV